MIPADTLTALATVRAPHTNAHTCLDGKWHNPNAGARNPCDIDVALASAAADVVTLHTRVHDAAHDTPSAVAVAEAMTGLVLADLPAEAREGWTLTARYAIEGLAAHLDRDPAAEARLAALDARMADR